MPVDIEQVRRLSPAALNIFKEQAYRQARSGDPYFSRLVSSPELADIFRQKGLSITQETPLWQKGLQTLGAPFQWISKNITEPFGAAVTSPFTPSVLGTENLSWLEREKAEYEQWKEPEFTMPWGGKFRPTKGIVETLPWLAVPGAGAILGRAAGVGVKGAGLLGLAGRGGQLGRSAALAAKVVKPIAEVEAIPGKLVGKAIRKAIPEKGKIIPKAEVTPVTPEVKVQIPTPEEIQWRFPTSDDFYFWARRNNLGERQTNQLWKEAKEAKKILQGKKPPEPVTPTAPVTPEVTKEVMTLGKSNVVIDNTHAFSRAEVIEANELDNFMVANYEKLKERLSSLSPIEKRSLTLKDLQGMVSPTPTAPAVEAAAIPKKGKIIPEKVIPVTPEVRPIAQKVIEPIPDLQDIDVAISIASRPDNLRKLAGLKPFQGISRILGGKSATMKTPEVQALVGRQILMGEGETKTVATMARLKQLGNQEKVFGKIGADGKFATGEAAGILQNELFTYPDKYIAKLNSTQRQWVKIAKEIEESKLAFLKRNKIKVNELKFEEGGVYAGQRVAGRFNKEGILEDVAYISPGARTPGAKAGFLKTRIFTDPEEAAKLGYRYLARDEALSLNVQASYNTVANKQTTDWLLERIPYRTVGATELTKAKRLSQVVRASSRGKLINPDRMRLISKEYPDIAKKLKDALKTKDIQSISDINLEVETIYQKVQLEWNALSRTEQISQRTYARSARLGEATVQTPSFQGKILTGENAKRTAELLNKEFSPAYSEALGAVNKVNAVGRYFALSGDMSPFGIQLIFLPWTNPKAYGESIKGFLKALNDKEFLPNYIARNADVINDSPGLLISAFEPTEAMGRSGLLGKLPVVTKVLEPFTRAYDSAMTIAGIEMKKSLRGLATTPERIADVDAFINELRGVISTARLGIPASQRQAESAILLAPKYNRAIVALLSDVFRSGVRGSLARDALLKTTIGISASAVAFSYAIGEDEEDIIQHLDPRSSRFLTWQIAGQNIGPGSKVRSILKLIGASTKDPEDLFKASMENPGLRFMRGNFAPTLSTGVDLLTGRDYVGDPTRDGMLNLTKNVIGENLVPIWVQSVIWEGGELGERGVRGVAEFVGGRAYPVTPYQELQDNRDSIAEQTYGMDWNAVGQNMGEFYQLQLEKSNPELKRLKEIAQKESGKMAAGESLVWDKWNQLGEQVENRYHSSVTLASQEYENTLDGATFRQKVADASLVRRGMYSQREQLPEFESVTQFFNQPLSEKEIQKTHPLDLARREYFKIMYAPDMYDQYGNYNFDLADQKETQFVNQFGQRTLDYIESYGGVKWEEPKAMKVLREAKKTLEPYWNIEGQVWSQYPPQLKQIAVQIQILERTDPNRAKQMLFQYPQIVYIRKRIAFQKKQIKMTNPDIAQALRMFYSY